jgi:hypothetical protein
MGNKIIFERWRRFLAEAELQYSKSAAQEVENLVRQKYSPGANQEQLDQFKIPQSEVYYSNNPKIVNGAVLYQVANVLGWDLKDPAIQEKLKSNWDSGAKSFLPDFVKTIFESPLNMLLYINRKDSRSMGTSGAVVTQKGKLLFYLAINPANMIGDKASDVLDVLEDTVRHEMQHVTQKLNGLALNYGEQIAKANGDFSKIKVANSLDDIKKFGIGREQTGLRQAKAGEAKDLSKDERIKMYLGDDFEYETWMSDLISQFIRWSVKQGLLSPEDIRNAKFKNMFDPNNMTNQSRKMLAQTARATGQTTKQVFRNFQGQKTFDELATGLVRELIKGLEVSGQQPSKWKAGDVLTAFGKDTQPSNVASFQFLSKLRRKEFLGDFLDNLTQRLKQQ